MNCSPTRRLTLCTALLSLLSLAAPLLGAAHAQTAATQQIGAGTVLLAPRGSDKPPPRAPFRTEAMLRQAAPTSQWYSTLIFNPRPDPIYAQPLAFKTTAAGIEMSLPSKVVEPTFRQDVEIIYPHDAALTFRPEAFEPEPARLARVSDWAIDISMARGADQLLATVAHGSPYAYFRLTRGDVRITLAAPGERVSAADARTLVLRVKGKTYAVFGPTQVRWEQGSPTQWIGRLPAGAGYFSATALPDDKPETLALLARHAYAFVGDTRVVGRYDQAASKVETTFTATVQVMEGADHGTLLGLYPHHWHDNAAVAGRLGPAYDTVRGKIRLVAGNSFKTERQYTSFVPHWPRLAEGTPRLGELTDHFKRDLRNRRQLIPGRENPDNWRVAGYWQGKGLTKVTQLAAIAEQNGDIDARNQLLDIAKERMEWWFSGKGQRSYFHLDKGLGAVVAYPDEFFHIEQMNDHHFWFGYWVRAAAEIAMRDPAWAAKDKWGGMVDLLVANIANNQRGSADFPYLRNFDPYEGHSWAVGIGGAGDYGGWGNNQESSSEALNAWAGLILWGEVTGNRQLRDLGVYLLTTEAEAINHYWFDIHRLVFAPEYKNPLASMVFGAKYAHNTWWTDEPRQIHGINMLPVAQFSTYLGRDPAYIKRNLAGMATSTEAYIKRGKFPPNPPPRDVWQDIFAKYLALADPAAALAQWNPNGSIEDGDTRTHTLHWMLSLQTMGTPDFSVRADTPLYAVFKRPDGARTYLAHNAGKTPIKVTFSDGKVLDVAPGSLGQAR